MNDDLDKLAAELQNLQPSKTSRETGMDAAMAAFDAEYARDEVHVANTAPQNDNIEEISNPVQGSAAEPRPTGRSTWDGRVQTFGRRTMATFNKIFSPKTVMMGGSCAAALMVSFVVWQANPADNFPGLTDKPAENIAQTITEDDTDEIVVTGGRAKKSDLDSAAPLPVGTEVDIGPESTPESIIVAADNNDSPNQNPAEPVEVAVPQSQGGISSVSNLLDNVRKEAAKTEQENRQREAKFRARRDQQASLISTDRALTVNRNSVPSTANAGGARQSPEAPVNPLTQTQLPGGYTIDVVPAEYATVMQTVVVQEASVELVTIPATYETVVETVVVQPQSVDYVAIPAEYEWVDGDIEGSSVEYDTKPAEYETIQEPVVVQEASTELVTIPATYETVLETIVVQPEMTGWDGSVTPAVTKEVPRRVIKTPASTQERTIPSVTKMETRRVVKTPATTIERVVPYEKRDGKTRVPVKEATVMEKTVPAVTKQVTRRVVKTPARTLERTIPTPTKQVAIRKEIAPQRFYLRDEDGNVVREFASRDQFEIYQANLATSVEGKPVSTFSIDVDTASYSFMRASLNRGQLPPRSSIRLEELINYFPYDYEAPTSPDEPFKANVTVTPTPWNPETKLMHIGIKGYVPPVDERQRSNIVFLIDTSGSMNQPNKLPLLINSFKLLLNTLDADDTVSIVTYAGRAGTVLEPTKASDKNKIAEALSRLRAGGSTAGAAGLELAYEKAQESFDDEGINRVILATDGDFNVGFSSSDEMKTFISEKRDTGIFLSVLGFGNGNYNDHLMQSLAQNGNGVAAYIDTLSEANKVLANEAGSALITIAKDVKIQVEFNPETISDYRLIGYETRALKREDFNNDKVDAGEIGAGHTVTAIYELTPVGSPKAVDKLRYVRDRLERKSTHSDEFAHVKIRHKLPKADKSTLQTFAIGPNQERKLNRASDDMRFATAVAAVGQKLRGDTAVSDFSYDDAIELAVSAKGEDENGYRAEFVQLVRLMENLQK